MRLLMLTLAAVIAAAPALCRADDDAASLLAKHRAFVGWQAGDPSMTPLVLDGDMTKDGALEPYARVHGVRRGLASRFTFRYQKGTLDDEGFTGRVFWESDWNGFTHPVVGDPQKIAISRELVFNEGATEFTGTGKGTDTVRGTACTIVQVKTDVSFPINLCIDPQTGAFVRVVLDPGGRYEETIDILKYDVVSAGKKIISAWRYKDSSYAHHWTKIAAGVPISDSQLHPPPQSAIWSFAGQAVPIDFEHNDRERGVYLTATVNGVKGRFLLDTGASDIVLNRSFAGRSHVKSIYSSSAEGIGGATKTDVAKVDTFQIGGNTLSNVMVTTLSYDLEDGKENDKPLDGILGYSLFGGAIVQLNLDLQQMTLFDPHAMQVDNTVGIPLTVDLSSEQPMVPMTINGNVPIQAVLDSGSLGANVVFSYQLASRYGLRMLVDKSIENITQAIQFASGIGGISRMECGRLDTLSVGPIVYQATPACQSRDFTENYAIVGFDFMQNFNIVFDYPEGKIILVPRASATS